MMAEGNREVKREAVEAGTGGAGGRPTGAREPAGEEVAQQGPAAAEPRRYLERIRNAIRACTEESLESVGGLSQGLESARKIFAQRDREAAGAPVRVSTHAWASTRIVEPERGA